MAGPTYGDNMEKARRLVAQFGTGDQGQLQSIQLTDQTGAALGSQLSGSSGGGKGLQLGLGQP